MLFNVETLEAPVTRSFTDPETLMYLAAVEEKIELLRWKAREELPDGSEDVAISHLTHALELKPDSPQLLLNRALFHMCREDTDAAELEASTALALDPALAEGYYWRACARAEAGHLSGAAADMRSCVGKLQHAERKRVAQQELRYIEFYLALPRDKTAVAAAAAAAAASEARAARGAELAEQARKEALRMLLAHATHDQTPTAVEAPRAQSPPSVQQDSHKPANAPARDSQERPLKSPIQRGPSGRPQPTSC
ncbi:hypothetical protein WJX75_000872 [Coccomyxa subellipsoidea]|uniref:TPR-like protein n=1 Tax=Coccomyxa subellipsoidea TaxID=248742 RepID=A0ABR2Z2L1_9CHLO